MDFTSGNELLAICEKENLKISEVMLKREVSLGKLSEDEVLKKLTRSLEIMKESARLSVETPQMSMGGLIGGEARRLFMGIKNNPRNNILGDTLSRAICYGLSVLEVNSSMGLVVAAPTAGSCGVIPGVLLALKEKYELSDEEILNGLLNASAVGYLFMRNASVSGAQAGCQAEIGTASAMASSAIVELLGGSQRDCLGAASTAISNLLGLVCDPIGGLVESPCQTRNAIGIGNAFISSELALSGIYHIIPFDEMAEAMLKVGIKLPYELRETALGGSASTPTACGFKCSSCG